MRTRAFVAIIVLVFAGAAVAAFTVLGNGPDTPRLITSQSYYVWGDSPRDWVSWADQIAVVEVVGEEQLALDSVTREIGEGFVGRRIEAAVEETVWTRPGFSGTPQSVTLKTTDGWNYDNGELIPLKDVGAHRSEVGDRLLVAMLHSKNWGWTLMSGGVPVGVDERLHRDADQTDIGEQLDGMTLPQVTETFTSAKPLPDVMRFQHLEVEEQMKAVHAYGQRSVSKPPGG